MITAQRYCVCLRGLSCSFPHALTSHTHTQTSCYSSVGHRLGILWKNMIGVIPTLWASSPHIFFISRGSRPVWVPVGPPSGPEGSWRGETWTVSSQEPSLIVHAIVAGRKLWGAPWLSWHRGSAVEKHWIIMAHYTEKTGYCLSYYDKNERTYTGF